VGHENDSAAERSERGFKCLGRRDVEIVGWFVEQQQSRATGLEQQDLDAGLLTAGQRREVLIRLLVQLVAAERGHGFTSGQMPVHNDLEQRACAETTRGVFLVEVARYDTCSELPGPRVLDLDTREQPQEVGLPCAVVPDHTDPFAVEDLARERVRQAGEREVLEDHHPFARAITAKSHRDALVARSFGRRVAVELLDLGLRRAQARRERVGHLRAAPELDNLVFELLAALPEAAVLIVETRESRRARRRIRRERPAVGPRTGSFHGHDLVCGACEQLAVVAHEQDGLLAGAEPVFEPLLGGDIEEVVGLVEQQHVRVGPEQILEHESLLFAPAQGANGALAERVVAVRQRRTRARVPLHLDVPAAGVAESLVCCGERDPGPIGRVALEIRFGMLNRPGRGLDRLWREPHQVVMHRRVIGWRELTHHERSAFDPSAALRRSDVSREEPQQRGLAGTVGPDDCDMFAVADTERDIAEERARAWQRVRHAVHLDGTHGRVIVWRGGADPGGFVVPSGRAERRRGSQIVNDPRLAIVGCGAISEWHVTAIAAAAPRLRITACVDPDSERAGALSRRTGGSACATLADAISVGVDAAAILVPHHLHESIALEAFAAGLHVLLEKPMATTPAACERILAAAPDDRVFMLGENAQYWPEVLLAGRLLTDGAIGELVTARAWHCFPPMGDFYRGETPWRLSLALAGGGVAIDAGSHWLRPLRMWCGELVAVVAATGRPFEGMEGESMCRALCRFESGVLASFDALLVPGAVSDLPLFQLTGTRGEIVIEGSGRVKLFDGSDSRGATVGQGNYFQSYEGQWRDFESAVIDGTPPATSARHALGEVYGALAMYRSVETGRWESVWP